MKTWICSILFWGLLCNSTGNSFGAEEEKGKTPATEAEAAITKIARDYEAAFNKGDAAALGSMFAEDVEYTDEDGMTVNGRDAVVSILKKGFVLNPGAKMTIQIQSVRSLTPDVTAGIGRTTSGTTSAIITTISSIIVGGAQWAGEPGPPWPIVLPTPGGGGNPHHGTRSQPPSASRRRSITTTGPR